jgi:DNA-binding FrmR family transcriptional regulator
MAHTQKQKSETLTRTIRIRDQIDGSVRLLVE